MEKVFELDYKEIEKRQYDAQQFILNKDLTISVNPIKCAKKLSNATFETKVLCPFCLNTGILAEFKLNKGLRVCPYCGNQLKLETLTELNNMDKFVKFVFNYRFSGFWQKVKPDFATWNKNLYLLGLSKSFWDKYKLLKGETKGDYEE